MVPGRGAVIGDAVPEAEVGIKLSPKHSTIALFMTGICEQRG